MGIKRWWMRWIGTGPERLGADADIGATAPIGYLFSKFGVGRYVLCAKCGKDQAELIDQMCRPRLPEYHERWKLWPERYPEIVADPEKYFSTPRRPSGIRATVQSLCSNDIPQPYRQLCNSCGAALVEGEGLDAPEWVPHRKKQRDDSSAFTALLDDALRQCPPPEGLTTGQISPYLAVIIEYGLRAVSESPDRLAAVRADANSDSWAKQRKLMAPLMGWLYVGDGPAVLQELSAETRLPVLTLLSCVAVQLWTDGPAEEQIPADRIREIAGVGLGLALTLSRADPAFVAGLVKEGRGTGGDLKAVGDRLDYEELGRMRAALAQKLMESLIKLGSVSSDDEIDRVSAFYRGTAPALPEPHRLRMVKTLEELAGQRRIGGISLYTFVSLDPSHAVVSSATLAMAQLVVSEEDSLFGVRFLAERAKQFADEGDDDRAASVLTGLLLLGDRRVVEFVGPCWRWLSPDGRLSLSRFRGVAVYAAVIDWLLDWLEDCEAGEFGAVAGTLGKIASQAASQGVIEVGRTIPTWSASDGQVVEVTGHWTVEEYGERLRRRLLQLACDEAPPRVMHEVLGRWGIDHTMRHVAGVAMRPRREGIQARPVLPLVPRPVRERTSPADFVPLEDADFVSRDGSLLLCWAIFNPFGPTWSCLGRLPTEDSAIDLLFFRMLNPFSQVSGAVAMLHGDDRTAGAVIAALVKGLFQRNVLVGGQNDAVELVGAGPPELLLTPWDNEEFRAALPSFFLSSPRMAEFELKSVISEIRATSGRPWDRASLQVKNALSRGGSDAAAVRPTPESGATPELIMEWLELIRSDDHTIPELLCHPGAWHGAIDQAGKTLAQTAFTFWELDDFLSRFGCPVFRRIATAAEGERDEN